MARLRSGFPQARQRSQRRQTTWELGPGSSLITAISASGAFVIGAGIESLQDGVTIVRLRGSFQAYLAAVDAVDGGFHVNFGIGLVTADAFAVGASAMPSPLSDADWDGWLYYRDFDLHSPSATIADNRVDNLTSIQFEIDSKAMRKFGTNVTIFGMIAATEVVNSTMGVWFDSRMLLKLP